MAALLWSSSQPRFATWLAECNLAMLCTLCLLSPWLLWSAALILPAVVGATMLSLAASCARDLLVLLCCTFSSQQQKLSSPPITQHPPKSRGRLVAESACQVLSRQQLQSIANELQQGKCAQSGELHTGTPGAGSFLLRAAPQLSVDRQTQELELAGQLEDKVGQTDCLAAEDAPHSWDAQVDLSAQPPKADFKACDLSQLPSAPSAAATTPSSATSHPHPTTDDPSPHHGDEAPAALTQAVVPGFEALCELHEELRALVAMRGVKEDELYQLQERLEEERWELGQVQRAWEREAGAHERVMDDYRQQSQALVHRILQKTAPQASVCSVDVEQQAAAADEQAVHDCVNAPPPSSSPDQAPAPQAAAVQPPSASTHDHDQEDAEDSEDEAAPEPSLPVLQQLSATEQRLASMQHSDALLLAALTDATTAAHEHMGQLRDIVRPLIQQAARIKRALPELSARRCRVRGELRDMVRVNEDIEADAGRELQSLRSRAGALVKQHKRVTCHRRHRRPSQDDDVEEGRSSSTRATRHRSGQHPCPVPACPGPDVTVGGAHPQAPSKDLPLLGRHRRSGESEQVLEDLLRGAGAGWLW